MTSNARLIREWADNKKGPEGEKLERTEREWQGIRRDLLAEHEDIKISFGENQRGVTIVSIGAVLFLVLLIIVATRSEWGHYAPILPVMFVVLGGMADLLVLIRCVLWFADNKDQRQKRRHVQRALDEWDLLYAEHAA